MGVYEAEEPGVFQQYRLIIMGGLVTAIVMAVVFGHKLLDHTMQTRPRQNVVMVTLPPPPPPPRATPPPPPQSLPAPAESEQKMIMQDPVNETETKPDALAKSQPVAGDLPAVGTSIQGDGSADGFGLQAGNSIFGGGTGKTVNHGTGSRWGWYANEVQSTISQALRSNNNTRSADFRVDVQIWTDRTGRITHAHIAKSTGNSALDSALTNEVLVGLIFQEPPPDGMPLPIVLRLTARNSSLALSR